MNSPTTITSMFRAGDLGLLPFEINEHIIKHLSVYDRFVLRWLCVYFNYRETAKVPAIAVLNKCIALGYVELVKWMRTFCKGTIIRKNVVMSRSLEIIDMFENDIILTCNIAVDLGYIDIVKAFYVNLRSTNYKINKFLMSHGEIEITRYIIQNLPNQSHLGFIDGAIQFGDIDIVKELRMRGCEWDYRAAHMAAECGRIDILELLRKYRCDINSSTYKSAARGNKIDVLDWLFVNKIICKQIHIEYAAKFGNLDIIRWFCKHGLYVSRDVINNIAEFGHFDSMKILMREYPNIYCRETLVCHTVHHNNLDIIKYLISMGCTWSKLDITIALHNCDIHFIKWMLSEGCPHDLDDFTNACSRDDIELIELLQNDEYNKNNNSAFRCAIRKKHIHVVQWLLNNGYTHSDNLLYDVAIKGHVFMIQWFRDNNITNNSRMDYNNLMKIAKDSWIERKV